MNELIAVVEKILENGSFHISSIEFDHHDPTVDLEQMEQELRTALVAAKASMVTNVIPDNVIEVVEVTEGVMAELNGKYYHDYKYDAQSSIRGFGTIEKAELAEPKFCKKATDMTYQNSYVFDALSKAKLVPVKRTVTKTFVIG
jgi:hypothetical protein